MKSEEIKEDKEYLRDNELIDREIPEHKSIFKTSLILLKLRSGFVKWCKENGQTLPHTQSEQSIIYGWKNRILWR